MKSNKSNRKGNEYSIDGDVATFYDSKGRTFTVDIEDVERVSQYTWILDTSTGYVVTRVNNGHIRLHRFIMNLSKGDKLIVDHIDHDKSNNCKANLRTCTQQQNNMNKNSKGVIKLDDNRWIAQIRINKRTIHLGTFTSEEYARAVRIKAEEYYFGEYSNSKELFNDPNIIRLYEEVKHKVEHCFNIDVVNKEAKQKNKHCCKSKSRKGNEYRIDDDKVFIKVSNGEELFIVDLVDYERIKDYTWRFDRGQIRAYIDGKDHSLNRIILDLKQEDEDLQVRLINNDTLDFRRNNLRVIKVKKNKKQTQ